MTKPLSSSQGRLVADDELEHSYVASIKGQHVGLWMIEAIESVYSNGLKPTEQSRAAAQRLADLGEATRVLEDFAAAAACILSQLHLQAAGPLLDFDEADEKLRRALLSARSIYRGDGPRNAFLRASEG